MAEIKIRKDGVWSDFLEKSAKVRKSGVFYPFKVGDAIRKEGWNELIATAPIERVWENGGEYDSATGREIMKYRPPVPAGELPMIIYLSGAGQSGTDISLLFTDGFPKEIEGGFNFSQCQMVAPQLTTGTLTSAIVKKAYDWGLANMGVDTTRVYIVATSLGSVGAVDFCIAFPDLVAAVVMLSPFANNLDEGTAAIIKHIPFLFYHTHGDASVPATGSTFLNINGLLEQSPQGNFAPEAFITWREQHDDTPWMRYMVDPATRILDLETDFLLKHSLDPVESATKFVQAAEGNMEFLDMAKAMQVVEKLSASADKTSLVSRLATLHNTITTNAGQLFVVANIGASATSPTFPINSLISGAPAAKIEDMEDSNGNATSLNLEVISSPSSPIETGGLDGEYFGMPRSVTKNSILVDATGTTELRISDMNDSKFYDLEMIITDKSTQNIGTGNMTGIRSTANDQQVQTVITPSWNTIKTLRHFNISPATGKINLSLIPNTITDSNAYKGNLSAIIIKEKGFSSFSRATTGKFNPALSSAADHPDWGLMIGNPAVDVLIGRDPVSGYELNTFDPTLWSNFMGFYASDNEGPGSGYPADIPAVVAKSCIFNFNHYFNHVTPNHNLQLTGPDGTNLPAGLYMVEYFCTTNNVGGFQGSTNVYCQVPGSGWQFQSMKAYGNLLKKMSFLIKINSGGGKPLLSCMVPNIYDISYFNALTIKKVS